ncbi:P-loop containing nucleoside triphosphate hydrolase protein, partial [Blyttiomyces helicus]
MPPSQRIVQVLHMAFDPDQRQKFETTTIPPPRSLLVCGPSGTGKTRLLLSLAKRLNLKVVAVNLAEMCLKFAGNVNDGLVDAFERTNEPCPMLLLVERINILFPPRGTSEELYHTFVTGIEALFARRGGASFMLAAVTPSAADVHPSQTVTFELPTPHERLKKFKDMVDPAAISPDVDLESIVGRCHGYTAAELAALWRRVADLAAGRGE